jgi:hypothetical protein
MKFAQITEFFKKLRQIPLMGYYRPDENQGDNIVIPHLDIRHESPVALLKTHKAMAVEFVSKMRHTFGWVSRIFLPLMLPVMDYFSHRWLKKTNNPYLKEIEETAKIIGKRGIYTMSMSYEWGCTSGTYAVAPDSVMLARVMDWPFPLLGDTLVVAHQKGTAGDFHNVTWPGYNGVVQGMAPGRFSAAINQAPKAQTKKNGLRNWIHGRLQVNKKRGVLPPPHALRKAFETAANYDQAKKMLMETPLTMPALFILAGTKEGEGCVIERTADKAFVREMTDGRVTVGNLFESGLKDSGDDWLCIRGDSLKRSAYARSIPAEQIADVKGFPWFTNAPTDSCLRTYFSRLVLTADAGKGTLQVMGTGGEKPVTKIFRLET